MFRQLQRKKNLLKPETDKTKEEKIEEFSVSLSEMVLALDFDTVKAKHKKQPKCDR